MAWWLLLIFAVVLVTLWLLKKLHFSHKDCKLIDRLDGKLVIVTGCNRGIGYETVGELARRGARVIMACRDTEKAELAKSKLLKCFGVATGSDSRRMHSPLTPIDEAQLICEKLDLNSPTSIRSFVSRVQNREPCVHILINNAAVNYSRPKFDPDALESHLKVNHLAPFLLTNLLRPLLAAASDSGDSARVINVSSFNHRLAELNVNDLCRPLVGSCYSNSKLANVIHARQITERWKESQIVGVSVHPGLVKTELFKHMPLTRWVVHTLLGWLAKTPIQGAQTVVYCAITNDLVPGAHYAECRVTKINPQALDPVVGQALWDSSEALVKQWETNETISS